MQVLKIGIKLILGVPNLVFWHNRVYFLDELKECGFEAAYKDINC